MSQLWFLWDASKIEEKFLEGLPLL